MTGTDSKPNIYFTLAAIAPIVINIILLLLIQNKLLSNEIVLLVFVPYELIIYNILLACGLGKFKKLSLVKSCGNAAVFVFYVLIIKLLLIYLLKNMPLGEV